MPPMGAVRMRLERLADERGRIQEKMDDILALAEDEQRNTDESELRQLDKYRTRVSELEEEITALAGDLEHANGARDVSALLRVEPSKPGELTTGGNGAVYYRTFAAYARDALIARYPLLAAQAAANHDDVPAVVEAAKERLARVQHTLTSDVQGLLPAQHLAQIMDIINKSRPVIQSARIVTLDRGKLTYPKIIGRPEVLKQATEKTEAGTAKMSVELDTLTADTYLGGGNLSWQAINWSTPDALQLWFDLAAEAYAQQTEKAACSELATASGGTIATPLGTTGTENFAAWRAAVISAISSIYATTGGRAQTDTLWLSAQRFFALAGVGTDQVLQVSTVGSLDISSMTGTWSGLRIVGSYGFSNTNTAVVGDRSAFLAAETGGAPIEMRAVEPAIGGMEVGVIGAFKSKVFDSTRFMHLS